MCVFVDLSVFGVDAIWCCVMWCGCGVGSVVAVVVTVVGLNFFEDGKHGDGKVNIAVVLY